MLAIRFTGPVNASSTNSEHVGDAETQHFAIGAAPFHVIGYAHADTGAPIAAEGGERENTTWKVGFVLEPGPGEELRPDGYLLDVGISVRAMVVTATKDGIWWTDPTISLWANPWGLGPIVSRALPVDPGVVGIIDAAWLGLTWPVYLMPDLTVGLWKPVWSTQGTTLVPSMPVPVTACTHALVMAEAWIDGPSGNVASTFVGALNHPTCTVATLTTGGLGAPVETVVELFAKGPQTVLVVKPGIEYELTLSVITSVRATSFEGGKPAHVAATASPSEAVLDLHLNSGQPRRGIPAYAGKLVPSGKLGVSLEFKIISNAMSYRTDVGLPGGFELPWKD